MATSTAQRVGIWVIALAMIIGTVAGFIAMILSTQNETDQKAQLQTAYAKYQKDYEEYQKKQTAQAVTLSKKYYPLFKQYKTTPAKFTASSITKLRTEDRKQGTGVTITDETKFAVYYIGWNPKGKVFDQSIEGTSLKRPLAVDTGLKTASLIEGWKEGLKGMKVGGVRLLTIPSDKAYGEAGSGEDIPANTPLRFIVMAIELPKTLKEPEIPQELLQQ